jgi:ATP-dependent DNA helicase RecQ
LERWAAWGRPRGLGRHEGACAAQDALDALKEILVRLCVLYGVARDVEPGPEIPVAVLAPAPSEGYAPAPARPGPAPGAGAADLEFFLRLVFGKENFRPGQREAVERALEGEDALVLLPTGGGKSIAYQLASLLLPGVCLAVEPTLSLIEDQMSHLAACGVRRVRSLTGEMDEAGERRRALASFIRAECHFFFVSPERLQTPEFRRALRLAASGPGINLVAVDEAHCVSQWGHDFRTSYLRLGGTLGSFSSEPRRPPVIALTGTASAGTLEDTRRLLGLGGGACIAPVGASRKELRFRVRPCEDEEKIPRLLDLLRHYSGKGCGIVFCPHVEGKLGAQTAARAMREAGFAAGIYHGRPPAGLDEKSWRGMKALAAARFRDSPSALLVATKAFGLGIDKPDVRFTVHLGLPQSPEALYQEAGRAGRDGRPADCWVLLTISDHRRARRLLDPRLGAQDLAREVSALGPRGDDVIRALRMHCAAFRGPRPDIDDAREILSRLGEGAGLRRLSMPTQAQGLVEKALHLLSEAGAVEDYAVRYGASEFAVRVSGACAGEVEARLEERLKERYRVIERRRREALGGLVEACLDRGGADLGRQLADSMSRGAREGFTDGGPESGPGMIRRLFLYLTGRPWEERHG